MMTGWGWVFTRVAALLLGAWVARRWFAGRAFDHGFTSGLAARSRTVRTMLGRNEPDGPRLVREGDGCVCATAGDPCPVHPYSVLRQVVELTICQGCGRHIFRREDIAGGAWLWNVPPAVGLDRGFCPVPVWPAGWVGHRPGMVRRG